MSLEQGILQLSSLKKKGGWQNWLHSQSASEKPEKGREAAAQSASGGLNQLPSPPQSAW